MTTCAWRDCYQTPAPDALIAALEPDQAEAFSRLRFKLGEIGLGERLEWREPPWRWCFAYAAPAGGTALAFLVPDPENPRLACIFEGDHLANGKAQGVSKMIRTALLTAPAVESVLWPEWPVTEIEPRFDDLRVFLDVPAKPRGKRKL